MSDKQEQELDARTEELIEAAFGDALFINQYSAARLLSYESKALTELCKTGKCGFQQKGKRRVFMRQDIKDHLASLKGEPGGDEEDPPPPSTRDFKVPVEDLPDPKRMSLLDLKMSIMDHKRRLRVLEKEHNAQERRAVKENRARQRKLAPRA